MKSETFRAQLLDELRKRTARLTWTELSPLCAQSIAEALGASRNLVSGYLNEWVEEGLVVKAAERPVAFFHRETLEAGHSGRLEQTVFESASALQAALEALGHPSAFDALVGVHGSLSFVVEQCKASIAYPAGGLPILLHGPTGTGKTMIAQLMYDYGREKGVLRADSRYVHLNCSEYANNPEFFLTNLFGHTKGAYTGAAASRKGLVALADGGVLFLDEVHCLTAECQEKLFQFMDKGTYHMVGDNDAWYTSSVRLIFATTEDPEGSLLRTLLRRIPIVAKVPALGERPLSEKRALIHHILAAEQEKMGRPIAISQGAYQNLLRFEFVGNAGQLVNTVRAGLAKAMLYAGEEGPVPLYLSSLPEEVIASGAAGPVAEGLQGNTVLTLEELAAAPKQHTRLWSLHAGMLRAFETAAGRQDAADALYDACDTLVEQYVDAVYFSDKNAGGRKQRLASALLESFFEGVAQKYNLSGPSGQEVETIACLLADMGETDFHKTHAAAISAMAAGLRGLSPVNWSAAVELAALLQGALSTPGDALSAVGELLVLDLFLLLGHFHKKFPKSQVPCIVAAHGRSTASSIAHAVNHILGYHLFDAVDMPVDTQPEKVAQEISAYFRRLGGYREAVVLVDMGSLEFLSERIDIPEGMSVGFVNNVTTKLAMDIGASLLEGRGGEEALEIACGRNSFTYTYLPGRLQRNLVLTVCSTGIATAQKIADMIASSFPRQPDLTILPYDFASLHTMGAAAPVFSGDRVVLIVGTMDPGIPDIPYVPVEQLIAQETGFGIAQVLSEFLSEAEAAEFDRNMVKNFSLMNLLDHLTILNPEKIFTHVEDIVAKLQTELSTTFRNGTVVGLYVHISCLIERLITDRYIASYPEEEKLVAQHPEFIDMARRIFRELEESYSVTIPVSEIGYLYEYVSYAVQEAVSKQAGEVSNDEL